MPSVIVVGAGLAGLNCARTLARKGFEVVVLEKSDRVGGRIKTDLIDGFRFDHGFQVLNPSYSEVQRLGITQELNMRYLPKGFEIELAEKQFLMGDPRENLRYISAALSNASGTLSEKIAFLSFLIRKPADISLGDSMRTSGRLYRDVIKGFLDGVSLTDSDEVSSLMAHELLRWFVKGNPGIPELGMEELPKLMASGLDIRFNREVLEVKDGHVTTSEGELKADFVVMAADPNRTRRLIGEPEIKMNKSWTWYHALAKGAITSAHLRVLRHDPFVNSVAISNISSKYAPENQTLISSTTLHEISSEEALRATARAWQVPQSQIQALQRYEIKESLPFHAPKKPISSPQQISERIFVAGDSFSIPAQQGALKSGRLAAELVIARR